MLRSQHAEATRRAVLDAAKSLFGRQGYAQTSVDEIADAARVTKGAVYHHFAGKEALFRAVYAEVETDAQARVLRAANPGMAPVDQMVAMMNAYLDAALDVEIRRITLVDGRPSSAGD
jgi:AcrR family transcriptional regulator